MRTLIASFWMLIMVVGFTNSTFPQTPSATLTSDSLLYDFGLDWAVLTINLSNEMFIDYTSLETSDFILKNSPPGLTIDSVHGISPTEVDIDLAFDGTDIDVDCLLKVGIRHTVLENTDTLELYTNSLFIAYYLENPVATLTADSILTEQRLEARTLTIDLIEEGFIDYTTLSTASFNLLNAPAGLTIGSITGISPTRAVLDLAFDGTDFDTNYTDFKVGINHSVLMYTTTGVLYTNSLVIRAYVENPVAELSSDSTMYESRLDYRILTINLKEERFLDYTSLLVSDFVLVNAPAGLTIESVYGISPAQVVIDLKYTGIDFDVSIPDFMIQISSHILIQTASGYLVTNNLTIIPTQEDSLFSIFADSINFKEWNYNQRKIVRTPEIGIIAESNDEIFFSYDLNAPVKIYDGKNASLAVDKNSNIHIVYEDNGIKYSVKPKMGNWQTSIMISDSSEIGFSPIADCDKDGNVHILYGIKDSCNNGTTYLSSLKYVKVSDNQRQVSSIIYEMNEENNPDTLINYTIATDLLFMDKTIFLVYQLSNDSIYVKYSPDYGASWKMSRAFPGTDPTLSIGFETFNEGLYDPDPSTADSYPVILYKDASGNLLNRYAEFYSSNEDFYWYNSERIFDGPIDYLCIDDIIPWNPVKPFGYSNIFQKDSFLYHAFSNFNENYILDTLTENAIVSSIAYKHFNSEKVDIIWYEKKGGFYEMYYQWFEKLPPAPPLELLYEYLNSPYVCHGGSSGSIYTFVTGGIPPYHYWFGRDSIGYSFIGGSNQYFASLSAGSYFLTVHDWNFDKMITSTIELSEATVETGEINGPVNVHDSEIVTYSLEDTSVLVPFFLPWYIWTVIGGKILSEQGTNSITVQWGSSGTGKISVIEHDGIDFEVSCNGASVSLDVVIIPTGYYNTSISPVNIFPNPFKDKATIQFPNSQGYGYDLVIMDLTGKIVRVISKINRSSYELNKGNLPEGLYLIELRGPTIYRGKIIIE